MMLSIINGVSFASKCNGNRCQRGNNSAARGKELQADIYKKTLEEENKTLRESLNFACKVIAAKP